MDALKEDDGSYSVRKFGGYMALIIIAYLNVSFTISNHFKIEVPSAYLFSIDGIIAFYFLKNTLSNLRFNAKVDDATTIKKDVTTDTVTTNSESTNK